jgi:two-component system phosphate regulon sensor histidine kinase PhoR
MLDKEKAFTSREWEELQDDLTVIQKNSEDALSLLNAIRNASKHEPLKLSVVDIQSVLLSALDSSKFLLRDIDVIHEFDQDLIQIKTDVSELIWVIKELILNATRAMPQAGGKLVIGCRRIDKAHATIWVKDNGFGVPLEEQEKVFGMFYRLDKNRSGFGIGLASARNFINKLNGSITLSSKGIGHGTIVTILLPLAEVS